MSYPRPRRKGLFLGLGIGVAAVVAALVVALNPGAVTPKDATASYIAAAAGRDIEAVKDNSCANDQVFIDKHAKTLSGFEGAQTRYRLSGADIDGDTATVPATINDEKYTFTLVHERGAWRVCFDYNDLF